MALVRRLVRAVTAWAWDEKVEASVAVYKTLSDANKRWALGRESQLAFLEELFREKQAKIKRLQDAHKGGKAPMYEDMRLENPIKDAESLAQSVSVLAARAEAYRQRTGRQMRTSDGTVLGVPGDRPNEPVGERWGKCGDA